MGPSCTVSKTCDHIGRESKIFHIPRRVLNALLWRCFRRSSATRIHLKRVKWWVCHVLKKFDDIFDRFDTVSECDENQKLFLCFIFFVSNFCFWVAWIKLALPPQISSARYHHHHHHHHPYKYRASMCWHTIKWRIAMGSAFTKRLTFLYHIWELFEAQTNRWWHLFWFRRVSCKSTAD